MKLTKSTILITAISGVIIGRDVMASPITWNGGGADTNWTTPGNWGGTAPVGGDSLIFDGSVQTTNVNNFAAGTNFAGITYASTAGAFTSSGSSVNLSGNITHNPANIQTTTVPFVLQNDVTVDVVSGGGTLNLNGLITGGFKLSKNGSGLLATFGSHAFTGGLDVNGGIFRTTSSGNTSGIIGTGTVSIANGAVLEMRSTTSTTFNNALSLGTGGGKIDSRSNHNFNPASITGSGSISLRPTGADNLLITTNDMKASSGQWTGSVFIDKNGRNGYALRMSSTFVNTSMLGIALDLGDVTSLTRNAGTNTTTVVTDVGALSSSFSTSSLGGSSAGSGYYTFSIGSLNLPTSFAGNIIDGGTKTALRKVGTSSLTLTGTANNFSGPSAINNGTLLVNGSLTSASLALTVNSGGILGGSGTIAGTVGVVGGTIAPGTSPGTLTINNAVTLNTGAFLAYELNGGNMAVGGGVNDLLTGVTNLTLDGTLNVTETVAGSFLSASYGNTWRLVSYSGTLTNNVLNLGTMPALSGGLNFAVDTTTAGQVNLTVVPEPTTLAIIGLGFGALLRRRRESL